jgi:hypothetical protein
MNEIACGARQEFYVIYVAYYSAGEFNIEIVIAYFDDIGFVHAQQDFLNLIEARC